MKRTIPVIIFLSLVLLLATNLIAEAANEAIIDARRGVVRIYNHINQNSGSIGSAFVVSHVGNETILVTNRHCVEGNPDAVYIVTSDIYGNLIKANVHFLSNDTRFDLAVLVTERLDGYKELPLAPSDTVIVSSEVYALGFPGLVDDVVDGGRDLPSTINHMTITRGIISNARVVVDSYNFFQTDATITGGNSGGPLLNDDGAVVGVNTYRTIGSEGYNYAIYIDYVMDYLDSRGMPYTTFTPGSPPPSPTPSPAPSPSPTPAPQPPPADSPIAGTTWELFEATDGTTTVDKAALMAAGAWSTLQFYADGTCLLRENMSYGIIEYRGTFTLSGNALSVIIEHGTMTGTLDGNTLVLRTLGNEIWTYHLSQQAPPPTDPSTPQEPGSLAGTTWELSETFDGTVTLTKDTLNANGIWMTMRFFGDGTMEMDAMGESAGGSYLLSGANLIITNEDGSIITGTATTDIITLYETSSGMMMTFYPINSAPILPPDPSPSPSLSPSPSPAFPQSPEPSLPVSPPADENADGVDSNLWIIIIVLGSVGLLILIICIVVMNKKKPAYTPPSPYAPIQPPAPFPAAPPSAPPRAPMPHTPAAPAVSAASAAPAAVRAPISDPLPSSPKPPAPFTPSTPAAPSAPLTSSTPAAPSAPFAASTPAASSTPISPSATPKPAAPFPPSASAASAAPFSPPPSSPPASAPAAPSAPLASISPLSSPDPDADTHLYCTRGTFNNKYFPIDGTVSIGRDPQNCKILFPDHVNAISRIHCSVQSTKTGITLKDLGSTHGTFLSGGRKLDAYESADLISGDCFYIADKENEFMVY